MTFEKTRKGNPLQLTIDQHFHSAHSIAKFYNEKDKVEVFEFNSKQVLERNKKAKIFCAKRNWDERAERGYMVGIESRFHKQIDNILSFNNRDHSAISKYFCLWRLRHKFHLDRLPNAQLFGLEGETFTKSQQEITEYNGVGYLNQSAEISARQLTGDQIQIGIVQLMQTFGDIKWGLLESKEGQYICADAYHEVCLIPISPTLAFGGNLPDKQLSKQEVAQVNEYSLQSASEFYFAQNLNKCPIAKTK